uniref:Zinc finger and BTB domain containing 14 n=1 Tax=Sparus aurata TaxID=8175 RepID=A0A671YCB9_SPAAU
MTETVKYVDDEHKSIFLKLLNEQRLEGEHCDIAVVVEDVKFRAHRCVLAACSNYFKKLFKKHEVDNSSVIEIDFIRSDIFEEVLNYMYTAKISVKKRDVNLMMSSGQILGIRFLDKLCSQVTDTHRRVIGGQREVPYDIVKMALPPEAQLAADAEVLGEHDDTPTTDDLVEASANQELDKSPSAALRVQEAILKELTNEDVHKVTCYDQDVVTEMEAEPKELGAEHHATQTLTFTDSMGEVKDEQPPGWSTATTDMKFEYLLYGHREQLACQVCGKNFLDESRLRKHEKLHSAERPFACEICTKAFTTHAHLKAHLSVLPVCVCVCVCVCVRVSLFHPAVSPLSHLSISLLCVVCMYTCAEFSVTLYFQASDLKRHENNMHSERKQLNPLQSDTETLQAAAMAAEEQHLDTISCS